ncbi:MAG: GMC family oxidoreductase [Microvirga sp.]
MLIDGRSLPDNSLLETDILVIGGGAAGITLALEFGRWNIPTCVLEAGGTGYSRRSQALYAGEVTGGLDYDLLSTRTRYLGGSSNCWSGWCRPFSELDLAQRDWVPNSGWPIGMDAFAPHYARAKEMLQLSDLPLDAKFWLDRVRETNVRLLPFDEKLLRTVVAHFSPPARLGQSRRAELEGSATTRIILHATASNILTDDVSMQAKGVEAKTPSGRKLTVQARFVILAAGGIENARLLLLSRDVQTNGLGNQHDVVGRYFADHPRIRLGRLTFDEPLSFSRFYDVTYHYKNDNFAVAGTRAGATIGLSEEVQRREQLLQCHTSLFGTYLGESHQSVDHCKRVYASFKRHEHVELGDIARMVPGIPAATAAFLTRATRMRKLVKHYTLESILEPVADPDSRVTLSDQRDELGLQRVRLTWRVGELEKRTHRRAVELIKQQVESRGLGRLEIDGDPWDASWGSRVLSTWHHMGTTRMHANAKLGVVDENCKVHGVGNLYVAGSSVFTTGGFNMPTINLVALAARLAGHIKALHEVAPVPLESSRAACVAAE